MSLPPSASLDDVKVRIREAFANPNVGKVEQVTLKEGPRAFRLATLFEILNPASGDTHHYYLKIDSIDRKKDGWFYKPEKSVSLESTEPDEIDRLFRFLRAHLEGALIDAMDDLHIISSGEYKKLEIVEIKTPFSDPLFVYDKSHDSYYPSAKLSPVIGQTMRYIAEVERNRNSILSIDGLDILKIRARAILGRDGPAEHREALRHLNGHLHRIEVLTFDQLARIAGRVPAVFGETGYSEVAGESIGRDEVPF